MEYSIDIPNKLHGRRPPEKTGRAGYGSTPLEDGNTMTLVNQADAHENWFEVLALWNRIANWIHYRTTESELNRQFKIMLIFLWNEKDWLKEQYPEMKQDIEKRIDESSYMCVVGDLANIVKHRIQRKKTRSEAAQTDYFGKVTMGCGADRRDVLH
jgi:hypothetical protein